MEWKYFREDSKDAGFDSKEVYKYPHIWIENHSLLHLRYEKQINLYALKSLGFLRVLHSGYLYESHKNQDLVRALILRLINIR